MSTVKKYNYAIKKIQLYLKILNVDDEQDSRHCGFVMIYRAVVFNVTDMTECGSFNVLYFKSNYMVI